jgi:chromosome segregation ATPase
MADVTLEFLARQSERILDELAAARADRAQILNEMATIREDIEIMSAMLRRMESWMRRTDDRVRRLEDRVPPRPPL